MKNIDVVVYVPAFNAAPYLKKCLEGIFAQTYPVKEVVVIDDGSTDDSARIATSLGARVIAQPENRGLSQGRNRAFREIEAPLIAALDADCVPQPDWLDILVHDMKNHSVAGTSGKLLEFHKDNPVDRWRRVHMVQHWGNKYLTSPLHLFGNNTLFRRDAVLEVGNYPLGDEYRTNNEDYYITRRLRERGYKIIYNPSALVYHHRRDSVTSLFKTYWNWFFLHKPCPDSIKGLWRKTKDNLWWTAEFLKQDYHSRDWELFRLSFQYLFQQSQYDFRYFLKHR